MLTGVPRGGYERCVDTLKFMVGEWNVSYFAVIREEFASEEALESLAQAFPGVRVIIVPRQASADAVSRFEGKPIASTQVMMWHEIACGARSIERLADYRAVLRVRFDIYFQKPENRAECISLVSHVVKPHKGFPLQTGSCTDANFYPVEIDDRDGLAFRWMALHAYMNVAVPRNAKTLTFLIHFQVHGWHLSHLTVLIDGFPICLAEQSVDGFGRTRVKGSIAGINFRRPLSKLGFSSGFLAVPSQQSPNSRDSRTLSVAIGSLMIDGKRPIEQCVTRRLPMPTQVSEGRRNIIADSQITIVFQGPWNEALRDNIARARECLPSAPVIVSSSDTRIREAFSAMDHVTLAVVPDPGPLPAYMRGKHAPLNNVNRQIVSSQAGLALAATPYAVKIRTDCTLESRAFVELYQHASVGDVTAAPLLASSVYTLHPDGIEGFPFHVSDWFLFGPSDSLQAYYDVPLMTEQDALWYDRFPHKRDSHHFARQYRSRFSPEQYIAVQNARKDGYIIPGFLDDARVEVAGSYRAYLVDKFIVCNLSQFGLVFEKYRQVPESHYQFFNCVWGSDWLAMAASSRRAALTDVNLGRKGPSLRHRKKAVSAIRRIDHVLGSLKRYGLMPFVGDILGVLRRFELRGGDSC